MGDRAGREIVGQAKNEVVAAGRFEKLLNWEIRRRDLITRIDMSMLRR
jgi:hypothetical protein